MQVLARAVVDCIRPDGTRGSNQPLVIQERTTKRGLEEVVSDRVVRMASRVKVRIDWQLTRIVRSHRQADGVAAGHIAVLIPAVELVLLLIEAVHEILRATPRLPT